MLLLLFGTVFAVNVYNTQSATSNLANLHWSVGFMLGGAVGAFAGISMGFPMMALLQFKKAYAASMAFQLNEYDEPLQCFRCSSTQDGLY